MAHCIKKLSTTVAALICCIVACEAFAQKDSGTPPLFQTAHQGVDFLTRYDEAHKRFTDEHTIETTVQVYWPRSAADSSISEAFDYTRAVNAYDCSSEATWRPLQTHYMKKGQAMPVKSVATPNSDWQEAKDNDPQSSLWMGVCTDLTDDQSPAYAASLSEPQVLDRYRKSRGL